MSMHVETSNRKAFELLTEALIDIDRYKHSKEMAQLESAKEKLEKAQTEDPGYMRVLYYTAMVNDLIGQPADAVDQFKAVLDQNPPFAEEVRYNLGVAYYHRYSRQYLDEAALHFQTVIETTHPHSALNLLSHAGLAQTYAMRMIQPNPMEPDKSDAGLYFDKAKQQCDLIDGLLEVIDNIESETVAEIRWATHNARGMSLMYYSDYFGDVPEKDNHLRQSLDELKKADRYSPHNWANYCDIGSAHMRIGHWAGSDQDFIEALDRLNEVVKSLRQNYGFALYEIGRVYRLRGDFKKAIKYFDAALNIEARYRDVSDERVKLEKDRAQKESNLYP
jgi:tetratricopeptide (TPR) repeat protein